MTVKVIIADDEQAIREGLKVIVPWDELSYKIVCEAANGEEARSKIMDEKPDVVLMDLNMPKMHGTEVIRIAREEGYTGRFIILSGYSDFAYAKTAIRYGVTDYLTKPVDEDELCEVLVRIKKEIEEERRLAGDISTIKTKAKDTVLRELITGETDDSAEVLAGRLKEFELAADCYQVICYETYHTEKSGQKQYDLKEILSAVMNPSKIEEIVIDAKNVLLLKSIDAVRRFDLFLKKYRQRPLEEDSPLDSVFLGFGRVADKPQDIHISYEDAKGVCARRFFCPEGEHTFSYTSLPKLQGSGSFVTKEEQRELPEKLASLIIAGNLSKTRNLVDECEKKFMQTSNSEAKVRLILTDILIQIKEKVTGAYSECAGIFPGNAEMIEYVSTRFYLYEIFDYIRAKAEEAIRLIRSKSGAESTVDDVIDYIEHNYNGDLTLENVAPLFSYNSVYFGKVFARETGKSFNSYVNDIRLAKAKDLLISTNLKIYEISERTGYNDVDYFSKKFRQVMGISPAEFRKTYERR